MRHAYARSGVTGTASGLPRSRVPSSFRSVLATSGPIQLRIYDVAGRLERTLFEGEMRAGADKRIPWNGKNASGRPVAARIYFCRLHTDAVTLSRKPVAIE